MKIFPSKLTNLSDSHNHDAEVFLANWVAEILGWKVLYPPTQGYFPDWDFVIANHKLIPQRVARVEVKISANGTRDNILEIAKADGSPGGLSISRSDVYLFINRSGKNTAKVRIVRTNHLRALAKRNAANAYVIKKNGDKIGSTAIKFDLDNPLLPDLMLAEVTYDPVLQCYDFSDGHVRVPDFAKKMMFRAFTSDDGLGNLP